MIQPIDDFPLVFAPLEQTFSKLNYAANARILLPSVS